MIDENDERLIPYFERIDSGEPAHRVARDAMSVFGPPMGPLMRLFRDREKNLVVPDDISSIVPDDLSGL